MWPSCWQPHAPALIMHVRDDDARIRELARAGAELADEVGCRRPGWPELFAALDDSTSVLELPTGRRDDYALAAGADAGPREATPIARGVASINWGGVPPRVFDAAEDTVDWHVEATGMTVVAIVRAAVIGPDPATGITVLMRSGSVQRQRCPGRRRPRHAPPGRRPAATTDRIGCLGPRLDQHLGHHRRRCRRVP